MAQTVEQLRAVLEALLADPASDLHTRINTLNALAWELRYADSELSAAYSQQAYDLSLAGVPPYQKGTGFSLLNLSIHNYLLGNFHLALEQLLEAQRTAEATGDVQILVETLLNLAHTYTVLGHLPVALGYVLDAITKGQAAGLQRQEADAYNKLGIIHAKADRPQQALDAMLHSVALYRELGERTGEAILLNDIAYTYRTLSNFESALYVAQQSLQLAQQGSMTLLEANTLCTIGEIYLDYGDSEQALTYFQMSIVLAQQLHFRYVELYAQMSSGQVHLQNDHIDLALLFLHTAATIAQEIEAKQELCRCYELLTQAYKRRGQFETALEYHERYAALYQTVFNEESDQRIQHLQIAHDTETAQKKAEIFRLKNVDLEREITQRQQSEQRYRTLFEAAIEGICIHDRVILLDANPAVAAMFGYSHEELMNKSFFDLIAPESRSHVWEEILSEHEYPYEAVGLRKEGLTFDVEILCKQLIYEGRPARVAALRDLTERKKVERQQLDLALERERIRILAKFITQASHEFRTPLSIIGTNAYLMKHRAQSDNDKRSATIIEQQVAYIDDLVKHMVALLKLDSNEQEYAMLVVELHEIVHAAHRLFAASYQEKRQTFVLDLSPEPIRLCGDADFLKQAIGNILDNACRYTPEAGVITIQTDRIDNYAMVRISDTGIGIGADALPHIFEHFYRHDIAGTTRGFGLGLSIAKTIVVRHRGRIEVESTLGQGSVFTIWLPAEPDHYQTHQSSVL